MRSAYCVVYDISQHCIGSKNAQNAEAGQYHVWNHIYDCGRLRTDWGDDQAYITSPFSNGCYWAHSLLERIGRYQEHSAPTNVGQNDGALVWDDASNCTAYDLFFSEIYGSCIEGGANAADGGLVQGNRAISCIFDCRQTTFNSATDGNRNGIVELLVTGVSPQGLLSSNVLEHCLILLGNMSQDPQGDFYVPNGVIGLRSVSTGTFGECKFTFRNNVVYGGYGTDSAIFALRNSYGAPVPTVISDGNIYCCPNMEHGVIEVGTGAAIVDSWSVPDMNGSSGQWYIDRGQDASSRVVDEEGINALFYQDGTPKPAARGIGIHRIWQKDALGRVRPRPPTPGPIDWP